MKCEHRKSVLFFLSRGSTAFLHPLSIFYSVPGTKFVLHDPVRYIHFPCEFHLLKAWRALAGIPQWIECGLQTKGSPAGFPVRAQAWVVGQVPSGGHVRGNHIMMFLSLFLPPFPTLHNLTVVMDEPPELNHNSASDS